MLLTYTSPKECLLPARSLQPLLLHFLHKSWLKSGEWGIGSFGQESTFIPVVSLLDKVIFLSLPTLVSRVLVFKQWAAKPEFSNSAIRRLKGFPGDSVIKNLPAKSVNTGLISGLGRCPGGENGNPLQYPCLGHSMDREASWGHIESQKSQTWLSN